MKILVVTSCFYPDIYASNEIVRKLVERGHKVTILTGLPDYTTSEIPPEYRHGQNRHQNYHGADVYRVPTIARRHGPIWRSLNYLSFAVSGSWAARHSDWDEFDVIYVWEVSPVTQIFPAAALKKRFHKPLYVYCMDIWPECVKAMGFREGTPAYGMIHRISRKAYGCSDHIAVSSMPFFDYLEKIDHYDRKKMSYLPQYGPQEMLLGDYQKAPDGQVDFLFIGNVGKAQKLEVLLQALAQLKTDVKYSVHIVGGGSDLPHCRKLAEELKLGDKVHFYGPVPFKETMEYYRRADACVFTLDGSNRIGDTLPGKVQTYMAAGKPIIAACNGAGKQVIEESGCGLCAPAGDSGQLAACIKEYLEHTERYISCGKQARDYFRSHFMEEDHFRQLERELQELIREYK